MKRRVCVWVLALMALTPTAAPAHDGGSIQHKDKYLRAKVIKVTGDREAPGCDLVQGRCSRSKKTPHQYFMTLRRMAGLVEVRRPIVAYTAMARPTAPNVNAGVAVTRIPVAPPTSSGSLAAIRRCESGGNYRTNTGNGFYGAYQFTLSTWRSVGGSGNPADASPAEQDYRAGRLHAREGAAPWPVCGR